VEDNLAANELGAYTGFLPALEAAHPNEMHEMQLTVKAK
jgi:hypothetical protein